MADRKAIARKLIEDVYGKGNAEAFDGIAGSGYVCHDPVMGDLDTSTVKQQVKALKAAFPDATAQIQAVIGEGDLAAIQWKLTGTHRGSYFGVDPTGKKITLEGVSILRFQNDRVVEEWDQLNLLKVLRQFGARQIPTAGMGAGGEAHAH